jgi:tetratricopeptide (TPR) repeat protein
MNSITWAIAAVVAAAIAAASPLYFRWLGRYPLFGAILAVPLAMIYGLIGSDLGLKNLFWHEEPLVQFVAGASVGALALILILLGVLLEPDRMSLAARCRRMLVAPGAVVSWARRRPNSPPVVPEDDAGRLRLAIEALGLPLVLLLLLPVLLARPVSPEADRTSGQVFGWYLPLGAAAALVAADLALRLASVRHWPVRRRHGWAAVLVPAAVLNLLPVFGPRAEGTITAAMMICLLCAGVALFVFATYGRVMLRFGLVVAAIALMAVTNGDSYKLSYPGLESYAGSHNRVPLRIETSPLRVASEAEQLTRDGIRQFNEVAVLRDGDIAPYRPILGLFEAAIRRDAKYVPAWYFHGVVQKRCGDERYYHSDRPTSSITSYELARSDYTRAIDLGDLTAEVRFQRGLTRERLWMVAPDRENLDAIIGDYSDALARDPGSYRIKVHLAWALDQSGQSGEADRLYLETAERMIDLHASGIVKRPEEEFADQPGEPLDTYPESPGYASYIEALQLADTGRRQEAVAKYVKALRTEPVEGGTWDRRLPLDQFTWHYSVRTEVYSGLLDDRGVLNRWRLARFESGGRRPGDRPKLVVVAVSGGGIVAAAWTMRCLTEIDRHYRDFPYQVRIITGASGGMVGAGLYVASLPAPGAVGPDDRVPREDRAARLREAIDRDSLTPVVRQMVLRDLPSIFCPVAQSNDRGRVLEQSWMANTRDIPGWSPQDPPHSGEPTGVPRVRAVGPLGVTFRDLRRGELEGWRPSLIVSPLLVENGAQMVISNLDLEQLGGINLHFFATFPNSYGQLPLSTGLRMNAAFPFVTPAVSLPTRPPRRIADAGYVDNYGVRIAAEWVRKNLDWLDTHTSGIALVQIRAYPLSLPGKDNDLKASPVATALQWLTSPVEGYTTARKMGMISLNDNLLAMLRKEFQYRAMLREGEDYDPERPDFIQTFVFECHEAVPLGWSLTKPDRARLDLALRQVEGQREKLVKYLRDGIAPDNRGGAAGP